MKIGFDAKRAFHNFTGLGNYSRTLMETLTCYYPKNEYHLFSPKNTDSPRLDVLKSDPSVFLHFPSPFFQKITPLWRSYFIKHNIQKLRLDVYHGLSHELPLSMPKGVKTVVTIHDLIHERYPQFYPFFDRKIYSFKFKKACEQANVVVAISEQTKQDIIDFYNIPAEKIKVIYQSCDRRFYLNKPHFSTEILENKRKKYLLNTHFEHTLLYVGSIIERKNLLNLLKTLSKLNDLKTQLLIVGKGKGVYFNLIMTYIVENNLTDKVHFFPNVPDEDLPFIYQNVDALVYPSFFEGFGIPIIEALWSGCPVITSTGSCFKEAGGDAALYSDPHNVDDLEQNIRNLLKNKGLRATQIMKGYDYVKRFHEKKIGAEWISLYTDLSNGRDCSLNCGTADLTH